MHLLAQLDAAMRERTVPARAEVLLLHANGLGLFGAGYLILEAWYLERGPAWAAGLAAWNLALAAFCREKNRATALHFVALGATLAAIAIGLQFDGAWITIGWAAEGSAMLWLALGEKRGWLRAGAIALLAFAAVRLVALQMSPTPAGHVVGLNSRVGSSLAVIALLYLSAHFRKRSEPADRSRSREIGLFVIAANILTLTMVSAEIGSYWDVRDAAGWGALARQVMLSVTWAAYGVVLIVEGIRRRYAPIRYLAIGVLGTTILKVLFIDLAQLDRVYRILSVVIVGVLLLLASYLYQRFSGSIADEAESARSQPEPGA
jgi:uncharacterized membrane protein